ncbi:WxL protein peptidoglycan domain-containing protein [Oerskovia enterophila]
MATQHLSLQAARDGASPAAQPAQDPRSAQRNASAHQRENGHSHALWLLAVLAVTLVVGLLVSLVAPGASAVASPASAAASRTAALPHGVSAAVGQVDPAPPAPDAPAEPDAPAVTTPVTWGVRPADTVHGTDRPNYAYGLEPGTSLDDAIIVSNYTEGPLTFRVYAADGYMTEAGELDLLPAGEESQALGSWVTFGSDDVTIEGGGTAVVPFTVTVPADATPGDYAAGVVSSLLVENAEGVSVDRRLGSRMHLRVAGDLVPAVVVDDVSVTYDGTLNPFAAGDAVVTFTVTNDGNTRLAPGQSVRVAGPWGAGAQSAPRVELPEMLPGTSLTRTVTVEGVWPLGRVKGSVTVSAEVVTAIGAADAAPLPVAPATGSASTFAVPWSALALLVLVAGGVVLQRRGARRRRASDERKVAEAVAQALKERDEQPVA